MDTINMIAANLITLMSGCQYNPWELVAFVCCAMRQKKLFGKPYTLLKTQLMLVLKDKFDLSSIELCDLKVHSNKFLTRQ